MSEIDIKQIEKNYAAKEDFEIERIATSNSKGLRPEVYSIIESEIKKRNLNPNLLSGAIAQNKEYTIEELNNYSNYLRELPCPICSSKSKKLNGTFLYTVKSFILFTSNETKTLIACPDCLDKKNNISMLSTFVLGWWGVPSGIIQTPLYLFRNFQSKKQNHLKESNFALLNFVKNNIGHIESYKNDKQKLAQIINH